MIMNRNNATYTEERVEKNNCYGHKKAIKLALYAILCFKIIVLQNLLRRYIFMLDYTKYTLLEVTIQW